MDTQYAEREKLKTELHDVSAEVAKIKAKAAEHADLDGTRFGRYLNILGTKCTFVRERLDRLNDMEGKRLAEIKSGVKEARQRLAIAKKAAKARFN